MASINRQPGLDLFGEEVVIYGKGYAYAPGSGPAGKRCKDCAHLVRWGRARLHSKCERGEVSMGRASDISMRALACREFDQREGPIRTIRRC